MKIFLTVFPTKLGMLHIPSVDVCWGDGALVDAGATASEDELARSARVDCWWEHGSPETIPIWPQIIVTVIIIVNVSIIVIVIIHYVSQLAIGP